MKLQKTTILSALIISILFFNSVKAQDNNEVKNHKVYPENNFNKKLMNFYGQEYLSKMKVSNPGALVYLNYFVENGYIIEKSPKDLSSFPDLYSVKRIPSKVNPEISTISYSGKELFNILTYDIQAKENRQYFRIGNSDELLIIKSRKEITDSLKK